MIIKKILINTAYSFIILFSNCSLLKNPLPKDVPADVAFSYSSGNDMSRYSENIDLSFTKGEYRLNMWNKKDSLFFKVDSGDIKKLYQLFRQHRIDQIKNRKPKHITYDASREGISLYFGTQSYNTISGSNFPFATSTDEENYTILRKAMYEIYYKYKNKP